MAGREGGQPGPDSRAQWRALTAGLGSGPGFPGLRGRAPRRLRRAAGGEARRRGSGRSSASLPCLSPRQVAVREEADAACRGQQLPRSWPEGCWWADRATGLRAGQARFRQGRGLRRRLGRSPDPGAARKARQRAAGPGHGPPLRVPRCSHHATRRLFKLAAARSRLSPDEIQGIENVDCLTHRPPDGPGAGHSSPRFRSCRHTAARARCWNTAALNEPHYERAGAVARRLPVARWPVARSPMARSASCTGVPTYSSGPGGALAARE